MFGTLGIPEIVFLGAVIPVIILFLVASLRGRSRHFAWLGFLGVFGLAIGLIFILWQPPPAEPPTQPSTADRLRELSALRNDGILTDEEYETLRAALVKRL